MVEAMMTRAFSIRLTPPEKPPAPVNFTLGKRTWRQHAQTLYSVSAAALLAAPVIPQDVDKAFLTIEIVILGLAGSVATIMAMISGIMRSIGMREEARKRFNDACVGFLQVLAAPVVIAVLGLIARGVLSLLPGYINST